MSLGECLWYDRQRGRFSSVISHDFEARTEPGSYRLQRQPCFDRSLPQAPLYRAVTAQGYIRIRHWQDRLGWEFHGGPHEALRVLGGFLEERFSQNTPGQLPLTMITLSDRERNAVVTVQITPGTTLHALMHLLGERLAAAPSQPIGIDDPLARFAGWSAEGFLVPDAKDGDIHRQVAWASRPWLVAYIAFTHPEGIDTLYAQSLLTYLEGLDASLLAMLRPGAWNHLPGGAPPWTPEGVVDAHRVLEVLLAEIEGGDLLEFRLHGDGAEDAALRLQQVIRQINQGSQRAVQTPTWFASSRPGA